MFVRDVQSIKRGEVAARRLFGALKKSAIAAENVPDLSRAIIVNEINIRIKTIYKAA